ncbi:MAG: N-acetylmuramoyl-L-alanine amidase [Candidatus Latescibacterota bacterium]|nr:MAG: N-acetylmuramoyl-L-alanine amidase [Candidatus Latescibacterota bacterium]
MRTLIWLLPLVLFALFVGCARPPKPKIDNVYRGLTEDLPRLDPSILEGRRVVVDPGHGGHFAGTRGQEGLEESMVNLGVSLYLWGLLREAGADVYMTRSAEKDFLGDVDSTVAWDLQVRVEMVDSIQPDIVVSIHHNAQADRDPGKNAVETYYRLGDPASRDLAFAVHRHLMRNLGIEIGEVRPGNYYILRNVHVPAILGEGSYLTHPKIEEKLRLSDKQRLEAEAYFLGILEYFSRGTPRIEQIAPARTDSVLNKVPSIEYRVSDIGGLGIDPASIVLSINETPVDASFDPSKNVVRCLLPWDAPNGRYDVSLRVRNLLGNSSQIHRRVFLLDLPAHQAVFNLDPVGIPHRGGTIHVRVRLLDERGLPVADGTPVEVEKWFRMSKADDWALQKPQPEWGVQNLRANNGATEFPIDVPEDVEAARIIVRSSSTFERVLLSSSKSGLGKNAIVLLDREKRVPVLGATISTNGEPVVSKSNATLHFIPGVALQNARTDIRAPGYKPLSIGGPVPDTVYMDPWFGGSLIGKRFVIHPEGGFEPETGRGRLGLSGAFVNLQVARYLAEYLESAGARVRLTRLTEETLSPRDIVAMTNRFRADRYIEIRHPSAPEDTGRVVTTFFFPGSTGGRDLAENVQTTLARTLGLGVYPPLERVTYPLQQTPCPAIIVQPPSLSRIEEELRLGEPWYQRHQAFGIFCGIAAHYDIDRTGTLVVAIERDSLCEHHEAEPVTKTRRRMDDETPVSDWYITIDDTWSLLSSPTGRAVFTSIPSDTLRVVATRGDQRVGPIRTIVGIGEEKRLPITIRRAP